MRWLLLISLCIVSAPGIIHGQQSGYKESLDAYRRQQYDSATILVEHAIGYFSDRQLKDSLVLAYVHKADIVWIEMGIQPTLDILDRTLKTANTLPKRNIARVAVLSKKAQLHVHNAETQKAKHFFLEALKHINPEAAPNGIYASLYNNISWLYLELQDFTPALQYAEEARKIIESLHGKDARQLIGVYQSLMLIAQDAGWYNQSETYGMELYRLARLHLPPDHPNMGLVHNDLGSLYESMYRMDESLFHRQQMVNIIQKDYAKHKNPQLLAIAYNNMGNLYSALGEPQLAKDYFEKAKDLHEINFGASGAGLVRPLVHLANIKKDLDDFDEAEKLYNRAYTLQKEVDARDWRNLAYVESQYGDLFFAKKQYEEAETYYKRALANHQKAGISQTSIVEQTRTTLAEIYARSARTNEALKILLDVMRRHKTIYPKGHIVIAGHYNKISEAHLFNNEPAKALLYSDSVFLELLQVTKLPDSNWIKDLPYNRYIIRYLQHRSSIKAALYEKNSSITSLQHIIAIAEQYGSYLEKSLPALRTQASLIQLATQHRDIYNAAIEACWELHQQKNNNSYLEKAFGFTERSKALLLRLSSNNVMIDANRTSTPGDIVETDLSWRRKISSLNAQYLDGDRKDDSLFTKLTASMEAYYRFQDSILRSEDPYMKQKYQLSPVSIPEIQSKLLNNQQTLLQYAVTGDHLFIFVLTRDHFSARRVPAGALKNIDDLRHLHNISPEKFSRAAHSLYEALIQPVREHFSSNKLVIIPDGELYYLNFELLVSDNKQKDFRKMSYLINDYEVCFQLSASTAVQAAGRKKADKKALILTPVFTDAMKKAYLEKIGDSSLADQQYFSLLRQPFAIKAAKMIGTYIKNDLFAEHTAVETVFKQSADDYHILHLGTHAEVNNNAPLQSRFFLAKQLGEDSTGNDDGYLHAYEVYGMQLQAEMAVLTACETGTGNLSRGEGVMSLAHSFMYAGCPSVIMSLWKIDEKASADIIATFYKHLAAGKSKSAALRLAKRQHMQQGKANSSHPYFWAGMALVGNETPVYTAPSALTWAIVLCIVLLIGIPAFLHYKSNR